MKKLLLAMLSLVSIQATFAQNTHKCGLNHAHKDLSQTNPAYIQEVSQLRLSNQPAQPLGSFDERSPQAIVTIPVVFHIIHQGEAVGTGRNLSVARIQQQISQLNADYTKTNTDISQLPSMFNNIAANCEIQFCLAAIDPQGNATTGITRQQYNSISNRNYIETTIKPATTWNAQRYLNVWVCEMPQEAGGGFVLGYAYLPTSSMIGSNIDGFVIDYRYVGTNASVGSQGRTATHEIGHYLGLPHPWGMDEGDCPGSAGYEDDDISDTPPTSTPNYTSGSCNFTPTYCNNTVFGSNYMDYSNDNCMHAFSNGQKTVMRAVLAGTAGSLGYGSRAQLVNNANTTCNLNPVVTCKDPVTSSFTMGFETTESLTGWVTENTNNDVNTSNAAVTWGIGSGQQTDGDYGPYAGNQYARYFYNNNGTTAANDWLFSPCINLKTGRIYTLKFYTAVGSAQGTTYAEKLSCYLMRAQNSAVANQVRILRDLGTISNAYPNYQETSVIFTVTTTGDYYLGFKCYSDADKYILMLDNINLSGVVSTENEIAEDDINVYPNPVSDVLTVDLPSDIPTKDANIAIHDVLGRNVYQTPIRSGEYRYFINETAQWAAGVYTVTISVNGRKINKRVVIQH